MESVARQILVHDVVTSSTGSLVRISVGGVRVAVRIQLAFAGCRIVATTFTVATSSGQVGDVGAAAPSNLACKQARFDPAGGNGAMVHCRRYAEGRAGCKPPSCGVAAALHAFTGDAVEAETLVQLGCELAWLVRAQELVEEFVFQLGPATVAAAAVAVVAGGRSRRGRARPRGLLSGRSI